MIAVTALIPLGPSIHSVFTQLLKISDWYVFTHSPACMLELFSAVHPCTPGNGNALSATVYVDDVIPHVLSNNSLIYGHPSFVVHSFFPTPSRSSLTSSISLSLYLCKLFVFVSIVFSIVALTSSFPIFFMLNYRDWETDRKSTRLNSSHITRSRMPSSA